jgi:nitroreductase
VETWDAIRSRRNVRSYGQGAIAPQDLDQILEAARRTPSAGNQQAWDLVVCTDRQQLAQLAKMGPAAGHVAGSAAAIALVAPASDDARSRDLVQFDLGQVTMSIMLAAADLGIGSAHAGVGDQGAGAASAGRSRGPVLRLADHPRRPRRPAAHADQAARPAPIHRRGAPRPLVAAPGLRGRCRPGRRRSASTPRGRTPTARSVAWCSASDWSPPDGSGLLTLDDSSVWTDPVGPRRIVWMIKRMIKRHPMQHRMARLADLHAAPTTTSSLACRPNPWPAEKAYSALRQAP